MRHRISCTPNGGGHLVQAGDQFTITLVQLLMCTPPRRDGAEGKGRHQQRLNRDRHRDDDERRFTSRIRRSHDRVI